MYQSTSVLISCCMFHDQEYSDVTFTCNGEVWHLHRAVLCSKYGFFSSCCSGNFMVTFHYTGNMCLPILTFLGVGEANHRYARRRSREFEVFLKFLYCATMELRKCLCNRSGTLLDAHVGVFKIAHKYGLPMLMDAVKVSLEESFEQDGYYPEQEELAAALEALADLSEAALLVRVFRRIIADAFVLAFLFQEKCPSGECQNAQ